MGMEARTGSITVAALVGTGLATIGFALSGVSALGDDLQTAARESRPTTPLLTPSEENRETGPQTTDSSTLSLEQICDRKRRHHHGDAATTTTPDTASPTTPAREL